MLIDLNKEEWKYIHSVLVHDLYSNGENIPDAAKEVQANIITRIESRLGL